MGTPLPPQAASTPSAVLPLLSRLPRRLHRRLSALLRAQADPRTPWPARLIFALTLSYALSPLDLIPDFIPILGQLDDVLLIPLGLALSWSLLPQELKQVSDTPSSD